jgi:cobalamin biosynthesis protein CobD/CbiB
MALDYISIILSFVIIILYLVILFFLIEIKKRIDGKIGEAIVYGILSIITLILLRIQTILFKANLLNIPYSQEGLALILVLFTFASIFTLYKAIKEVTDKKMTRIAKSPRVRKKKKISGRNNLQRASKEYLDLTK